MPAANAPDYSLAKEAEDVAALEAAFRTDRIGKLMLYEPPLHEPAGNHLAVATKVEESIKKGQLEEAFIAFQTEIVKQSDRMKSVE